MVLVLRPRRAKSANDPRPAVPGHPKTLGEYDACKSLCGARTRAPKRAFGISRGRILPRCRIGEDKGLRPNRGRQVGNHQDWEKAAHSASGGIGITRGGGQMSADEMGGAAARQRGTAPIASHSQRDPNSTKSGATAIDFATVNAAALAALPAVLARVLPRGKRVGKEIVALNPRRPDRHLGSYRVNRYKRTLGEFCFRREGWRSDLARCLSRRCFSERGGATARADAGRCMRRRRCTSVRNSRASRPTKWPQRYRHWPSARRRRHCHAGSARCAAARSNAQGPKARLGSVVSQRNERAPPRRMPVEPRWRQQRSPPRLLCRQTAP